MDVQTEVLKKLDQYNESLLDNEDYDKRVAVVKKKSLKRKKSSSESTNVVKNTSQVGEPEEHISKKRRKRLKKRQKIQEATAAQSNKVKGQSGKPLTGKRKHLRDLVKALELDKLKTAEEISPDRNEEKPKQNKQKQKRNVNKGEIQIGINGNKETVKNKNIKKDKESKNSQSKGKLKTLTLATNSNDKGHENSQEDSVTGIPESGKENGRRKRPRVYVVVHKQLKNKVMTQRRERNKKRDILKQIKLNSRPRRNKNPPVEKKLDGVDIDKSKKKWQKFESGDTRKQGKQLELSRKKKQKVLDMQKMRLRVAKFALQGGRGQQEKKESKLDFLYRLGAKKPKNKPQDYKKFMEKRKQEMVAEKKKNDFDRMMGYKVKKKDRRWKRKDVNDIGILHGQVGKFKDGVQFIKQKDLKGFKKKK